MKKVFLFVSTLCTLVFFSACNDQSESKTHQHEDGAVHDDHAPDTAKVKQQEFTIGDSTDADTTTKEVHSSKDAHSHKDGEKHSH